MLTTRWTRTARLLTAAVTVAAAITLAAGAATPAAASPGGGGCYPIGLTWICVYSTNGPGSPGSASSKITCTYAKAPAAVLQRYGVGPPPHGYRWDIMTCPGRGAGPLGGSLILVNTRTGRPAITPFDLLKIAIGELRVPTLTPLTAPPRGKDGLVGLPEWFWVPPPQWRKVSVTVTAGPVWAMAVAAPARLTFIPGGGLGSVSCPGPGTAFTSSVPAARQHTSCSYTYRQPSAGQPGNAYQAALAVTWTISWTGSGGVGGVITNGYTTATALAVRIAQAEALVTTP